MKIRLRLILFASLALASCAPQGYAQLTTLVTGESMRDTSLPKINAAITQVNANTADIALRATLASPALTGTPTAPTAATTTATTQVATTAFVQQELNGVDSINLAASASTASGGALEADNSYSGLIFQGLNGGATIAQWQAVYFDGTAGEFLLADADGSGTRLAFGLAVAATTDGNPISIIREGFVRNDAFTYTPGARLYLSTTAGALTETAPAVSGDTVKEVGFVITADIIFVDFSKNEYTVE